MKFDVTYYPKFEEKLNIISHGIGVVLSVIAFPFLVYKACKTNDPLVVLSFVIYGISMIVLYTASTLYHSAVNDKYRYYLNIFDHASIYILIAGTYAPVALVVLQGTVGWLIFGFSWVFALIGVFFKIYFIGKYRFVSIVTYLSMGWMIVFAINPLLQNFSEEGLKMLFFGGISYSIGAVFFIFKNLPYNHAIFHVFVLLGSLFHFIAIYYFVLD
jgi:hemolysin III